jgi:hypothetical protein
VSAGSPDFESLLRQALQPVEPPEALAARLETTLADLTELAQDELEAWELSSMRDPRNWVRPVAAAAIGGAAGSALLAVRIRRTHRRRRAASRDIVDLAGRTLRDAMGEAEKIFRR